MADFVTPAQKAAAKSEGRRKPASSFVWNRMLLASGLASGLVSLILLNSCAPKVMYRTGSTIETLLGRDSRKKSLLRVGESRTGEGYAVTLSDVKFPYGSIPPKAVLQVSGKSGDEEFLFQTELGEGEIKQFRLSDGTILELSVRSVHTAPVISKCGANFSFRKLKSEGAEQAE